MLVYSTNESASGLVTGSVTAKQLPDVRCVGAYLQAVSTAVTLGGPAVAIGEGISVTTTPLFYPVANLNLLYVICADAGDDLIYHAVR